LAAASTWDAIIVGGGLAGSALAGALAERGQRVLVLERETCFRDRVRGEQMHPWGVGAARLLGIYEPLLAVCGHPARWWSTWAGRMRVAHRDLQETNPHGVGSFHFYHPVLQETLLRLAASCGAEVRRGAIVTSVAPGDPPRVRLERKGRTEQLEARLVVGADGRSSRVRAWAGFRTRRDPGQLAIAGALFERTSVPDDGIHLAMGRDEVALVVPLGGDRARAYLTYRSVEGRRRLRGRGRLSAFLEACRDAGAPPAWFDGARPAGPLAEFDAADRWVDHPARDGVALIGDAAAAPNPCWGSGLSLALLDVLHLRDRLCATPDWKLAIDRYAEEHDRYYASLRRVEAWMTALVWSRGPGSDERRLRVMPRLLNDPSGLPDIPGLGPDSPGDPDSWSALLGEG
jgi:2-polyprenyl-6-methoxyphenol hydroxylase-like FAD-dependent oxidoreductase